MFSEFHRTTQRWYAHWVDLSVQRSYLPLEVARGIESRSVVKVHYGTVLADEFAAMSKMRHIKKSHSALWQPSRPGLPRKLKVANITRIFLFYVNSVPEPLLNAFTHIQKILLLSYRENIKPKNVSRSAGQNNFWSFLQAWHWNLKKLAQFFQFSIHVHPCYPLQQTTGNNFNIKEIP